MKVLSVINNDKDAVTKEYVDSKAGVTAVDPTSGPVETDFFIPTKTSELTNDSGYLTSETDPVFNASVAKNITSTDITNWNNKQAALVSGTNIKTINNTSILGSGNINIQGGSGSSTWGSITGTLSDQADLQTVLNSKANASSIPIKVSQLTNDSGFIDGLFIATYGTTSFNDVKAAIQANKIVYCYAPNNRYAFLAYGTTSSGYEFQYYRSLGSPTETNQPDEVYVYKITSSGWTTITRKASSTITAGTGLSRTYTPSTRTVNLSVDTGTIAQKSDIPTKTSDLTNDSGFITSSSLPTKVSDLTNDSGFITNTVNNLTNYYTKTNTYTKSEVDSLISSISSLDIQIVQTLPTRDISTSTIYLVPKTVSTNDNYDEYIYVNNSWEHIGSTEVDLSNYYTKTQTDNLLDDKADVSSLSTVATTGSYNDLSNKPTIPTVNNATLTIQKNGTTVKTFTANASTNVTANIEVPTKTSDLTNDSGFVDNTYHDSSKQDTLVSGTNIKTINNESILGSGNISLPQVTDSYSASTTDSYSCNYVNGLNGKILYENPSGTSSSFSLSEYWKNFKEIEVYFLAADWLCNSSKMDCNSQASLVLATPYGEETTSIAIVSVIIQFSGTTVSFTKPRTMTFDSSYDAPTITASADIKVTKVIGYR